ncbi:MAG: LysM peptidoglycan-binding domain-containing protein [Planctomycetota bacterium]
MTRETKVGLLMVVMLVGVFGFMVYKQMHRPLEGLAEQKAESVTPENEGEVLPFANAGDSGDALTQRKSQVIPAAAAAPGMILDDSSAVPATQREENPFEVQSAPTVIVKPRLPTTVPNDDAFFDAQPKQTTAVEKREPEAASSQPTATFDPFVEEVKPSAETKVAAQPSNAPFETPAVANSDPFEAPLEVAKPAQQPVAQSAPVDDPFESVPSSVTRTEQPSASSAPPSRTASLPIEAFDVIEEPKQKTPALTAPTFEPASSDINVAPQSTPPTTPIADDDRLGGFRPVEVSKRAMNEFAREERTATTAIPASDPFGAARRPAPAARIDEDFAPRSAPQALVPGDTYNIEPNDNYWTISRKKYGTGRYFMALSQHNLQVIPDPKRMKPGVTIATPSTDVLDKTYPTLIPKAAPSDSAPAGGTLVPATGVRRTNATTNDEAGFFVSTDGTPMYRVGSEDTLSDIAKHHLGRSSRWVQIFEMNRDTLTDGNTLKVGTLLRLPGDASRVDVVGAPRTVR